MVDAVPGISADEFRRWLTPRQALKLLGNQWIREVCQNTILRMLAHKQLDARAGTMVLVDYGDRDQMQHRVLVPSAVWGSGTPDYRSYFWDNGLFDFKLGDSRSSREFSCFDVRFDPDVIHGLLEHSPEALATEAQSGQPRKTRHGLPALKDEALERWYELFLSAYPNGSKTLAEASARGMFPDHSVDRQKVRDLFGPGKMGRPLKNRDN
jgi:hypothetical protein